MTASTPRSAGRPRGRPGCPPPPLATTTKPASTSACTAAASRISSGSGEATTRRQPFSPRSSQVSPCSTSTRGLVARAGSARSAWSGRVKPGSSASTSARVTTVALRPPDAPLAQRVVERVHQHEAQRGLGLRAAPVQRHRGYDGRGDLVLDQQVADLRAVAVGDDDVDVAGDQLGDAAIATCAAAIWSSGRAPPSARSSRCRPGRAGPSSSTCHAQRRAGGVRAARRRAATRSPRRPPPARRPGPAGPVPATRSSRPGSPAAAWMPVRTMPGRDAVDPDAARGDLLGEPDGQRVDTGLGGGVVDVLVRGAQGRRGRGDVDDRAARVRGPAPPGGRPGARR